MGITSAQGWRWVPTSEGSQDGEAVERGTRRQEPNLPPGMHSTPRQKCTSSRKDALRQDCSLSSQPSGIRQVRPTPSSLEKTLEIAVSSQPVQTMAKGFAENDSADSGRRAPWRESEPPGGLLKYRWLGPRLSVSDSVGSGRAWKSAALTGSQMLLQSDQSLSPEPPPANACVGSLQNHSRSLGT